MESLLFMLNSIAVVALIVMSLRDDRRDPEDPHTSFFRMTPAAAPDPVKTPPAAPGEPPAWADWLPADQRREAAGYADRQGPLG